MLIHPQVLSGWPRNLTIYEEDAILGIREKEGIGLDFETTELFTKIDILSKVFQVCCTCSRRKLRIFTSRFS